MAIGPGQADPSALPADLRAIVDELGRTDQQAGSLIAGLSDAQLNWQPGGGTGWSVAQCLDHLAQSNALYVSALQMAVRQTKPGTCRRNGAIRPGWLGRRFIAELEPPPKRKIRAQKKVMPPGHLNSADVLKAFLAAHEQVRLLVAEARDLDLNRIRFRNPFLRFLPWTVGTGLMVIGAHDRRHLWQAQQVVKAMEQELSAANG